MKMILRDIHFPIREATISGLILNPDWLNKYGKGEYPGLSWFVEVNTEEQDINEDSFASPRISWGEFSFPIRRWSELEGKTIQFDAARDDLSKPHPFSYFWTHELIPHSTLKFVERTGNKFLIHWEGTCDPLFEEPYNKNVPFRIETEATFTEINVQAGKNDTDATTRARLAKYIDPADFIQHPIKETVRDIPVENRFGVIDPLLRWIFRTPDTRPWITRNSLFEPRL